MNIEEVIRLLEEWKKRKEKDYTEFKGMLKGIQLGKLSPIEKIFVRVLDVMMQGFNDISDNLIIGYELQIATIKKANSLEKRIKELENNVLQLRETLDTMFQAK